MSDTKNGIIDQIRRAAELITGRGQSRDARIGIKATMMNEFGLTSRQAGRRIAEAKTTLLEHHRNPREDQTVRTVAQLDRLIDGEQVSDKVRLDAINTRISLLGLSPGSNGDPGTGAPQAPYAVDPTRGQVEAPAVARAREIATDKTDGKEKTDASRLPKQTKTPAVEAG